MRSRRSHAQVRLLIWRERPFLRHREDVAAQWLWMKRLTDEAPLTALQTLADNPLPPFKELTPDSVDARLTVPENYPDEAAIDAWRERYRDGLALLADAMPATFSHDERLSLVRHTAAHANASKARRISRQ